MYQDGEEYYRPAVIPEMADDLLVVEIVEPINEDDRDLYCFTDEQAQNSLPALLERIEGDLQHLTNTLTIPDEGSE